MATKSYIELPSITEPTNLDVLAIVDSGYTTTYQITRQNLLNSSSPLSYVKNKQNILSKWCDDTSMSSGQWFSTIIGGSEHRIEGDNFYNTILGGKRNRMTGGSLGFRTIIGGLNNSILNANGYNGIFGGYNNTINGGDYATTIIGGYLNTLTNCNYGASIIGSVNSNMNGVGTSAMAGGFSNNFNASNDSFMGGGRSNTLTNQYDTGGSTILAGQSNSLTGNLSAIIGGESNIMTSVKNSNIIGGLSNSLTSNDYSAIFGGSGNTMASSISAANGKGNYIINSRDCKVEKDGQYQSNNVNYIGCDNVRLENLNDVTIINCKNLTAENGGVGTGTTIFRNTYTLGANIFQAETYVSTGATTTILINPLQQDYIEINTDGSTTYNISFTFVDSAIYANIHLYINYVSGSTVNFVNGASTQWRWNNNSAPVFSGTNRNIIVMSTWANDDVWEVSRSMYMS